MKIIKAEALPFWALASLPLPRPRVQGMEIIGVRACLSGLSGLHRSVLRRDAAKGSSGAGAGAAVDSNSNGRLDSTLLAATTAQMSMYV